MEPQTLLSEQNLEMIAQAAGTDTKSVSDVASTLLPLLMSNMTSNASTSTGAASLLNAMLSHADDKDDKTDEDDGNKILGHILGLAKDDTSAQIAKKLGLNTKTVAKIAAMVAPILLSQLGKEAKKKEKKKDTGLDIGDVASLLIKVLG